MYVCPLLVGLLAGCLVAPLHAQSCIEDIVCVVAEQEDNTMRFYVDNLTPGEVTVSIEVEGTNLSADQALPHTATYPGRRRTPAFSLYPPDRTRPLEVRYMYQVKQGSLTARHDDAYSYALPYAPGKAFEVVQGFGGRFSHQDLYAIDWEMPEGTRIRATRGGVVVGIEAGETRGGLDEALRDRANFIRIRHDDGTIGQYLHLKHNSVFVEVGQTVRRGQEIGLSGSTGYSAGPHLHFEVFKLNRALKQETVPIAFRIGGRSGITLQEGRAYRAAVD